jgi:hypothetical protein
VLLIVGCAAFPERKVRDVASEKGSDNPVKSIYLEAVNDGSKGNNFLGSLAPLVPRFSLHEIKAIISEPSGSNSYLMIGFGSPQHIELSAEEVARFAQNEGDFGFISLGNAPANLKPYLKSPSDQIVFMAPERDSRDFSERYQVAQLFSHYVHESFHMAQSAVESKLSSSGLGIAESSADITEHFCSQIFSNFISAFFQKYTSKIVEVVLAIEQGSDFSLVREKIREVSQVLRELKAKDPKTYESIKIMEYIEGSAEYVGMTAAIKYVGLSRGDAILYQLGYPVKGIVTGNDLTYRNAALAGLISDHLGVRVKWNRKTYIPKSTWWEYLASSLPLRNGTLKPFPLAELPKNDKFELNLNWMKSRYCQ